MPIHASTLAALVVLALGSAGCIDDPFSSNAPPAPAPARKAVDPATLAEFERGIGRMADAWRFSDLPEFLWPAPGFIPLYENPELHAGAARELLTRASVPTERKLVVAYAMQCLSIERFLDLVSATADAVEAGATDVRVLENLAFAPLNWGRQRLLVHWREARVRAVLLRLERMPQLDESSRVYVREQVLTGVAKRRYYEELAVLGRRPAD